MSKWPVGITASPNVQLVRTAQSADLARRQAEALASLGKRALAVRPLHLAAPGCASKEAIVRKVLRDRKRKG
jgi:hypothetical protein